jgi:hypothetical protein
MENDFTRILAANVTNFSGMNNLTPSVDYGDIRLCFNDHETTSCVRLVQSIERLRIVGTVRPKIHLLLKIFVLAGETYSQ